MILHQPLFLTYSLITDPNCQTGPKRCFILTMAIGPYFISPQKWSYYGIFCWNLYIKEYWIPSHPVWVDHVSHILSHKATTIGGIPTLGSLEVTGLQFISDTSWNPEQVTMESNDKDRGLTVLATGWTPWSPTMMARHRLHKKVSLASSAVRLYCWTGLQMESSFPCTLRHLYIEA